MNIVDTDRGKLIDLYVLQLESSKLYVGQSIESEKRIERHFCGKGSSWTKLYKPIKTIKIWNSGLTDWKIAESEENRITLSLMVKFGWKNVRGGYWANVCEHNTYKNLQHHKLLIEKFGHDFTKLIESE